MHTDKVNGCMFIACMRCAVCYGCGLGLASASWRLPGSQTQDLAETNGEEGIVDIYVYEYNKINIGCLIKSTDERIN